MRRASVKILFLSISLILVSCASNVDDIAAQENGALPQWPPAPQSARISYLYSVTTPNDANIGRGFIEKTWRFIKGGEPVRISKPQGLHVDLAGRLYVVDTGQGNIHVFDSKNSKYFSFPDKPIANFEYPVGIAADGNGRVYVSDASTNVVHVFDSFGKKHLTSIGHGLLRRPTGLALRSDSNELLVVDTLASEIVVFDTDNFDIKTRAGRSGQEKDAFHYPTNIALAPYGGLYITDALNFRIQILSADLEFEDHFGGAGDGPGFFSRPKGVAVDSDRNIYVVDALFDNIQMFNRGGELLLAFGTSGHAAGEFWLPNDIFIDSNDRIYVSDSYNSRVQIFEYHSMEGQQ
jgi:DNA-binding beta-propeller fold protein YncE